MASLSSLLSSSQRDSTDNPWQVIVSNIAVNEVLDLIAKENGVVK